jgi:cytochrome oxidase Cu insertion factor (SCO1/SenC/PrrC family)
VIAHVARSRGWGVLPRAIVVDMKGAHMTRALSFVCAVLLGGFVMATPLAEELKAGDKAPDFTLQGSDGKMHSLADLKGKTVVLAWFPKAFTGG